MDNSLAELHYENVYFIVRQQKKQNHLYWFTSGLHSSKKQRETK